MINRPLIAAFALFLTTSADAQNIDLVSRTQLRVCADPSDLPFSDDKKAGFENKIAEIVGRDLGVPVNYVWFPRIGAFARNTLGKRLCDLVIGAPAGDEAMDTTSAYYHSGYMLVSRADGNIGATAVGDPALAKLRIGLIAGTPPTDLLIRHGLMPQVTSYSLAVDTRFESPARELVQDIVDRKIDVGLLWGPIAGYYVTHEHMPLKAVLLDGEAGSTQLDYHIAMGVRAGETDWRRQISQVIERRRPEIAQVLIDYGVPMLDEQDRLIKADEAAVH